MKVNLATRRKTLFLVVNALLILLFVLMNTSVLLGQQQIKRGNGKGAFATKKYRNLFKENGNTVKEINLKINNAFQQLFYGTQEQSIYFKAGRNQNGPLSYVLDVFNKDIRSEGMSYGMMIAVQMNRKAEFDALWNYAITNMYIDQAGHPAEGYFSWSVKADVTAKASGPAPDGEEYFIMALYFASGRWGNGDGIYNYRAWADKILSNMRHRPLVTAETPFGPQTSGSMINEQHKMIRFVPGGNGRSFSDPSYHLPAFYELWARYGPMADRAFWAAAADTSRNYFQKAANPNTGLAPDYADFAGKPVATSFNVNSHYFAYDSWRTAMNWSVDWSWWKKDKRHQKRSNTLQRFFASKGIYNYGNIYTLEGQQISADRSAGLVAANATVSLAATHPLARDFVEALWDLPVPENPGERYYGGLLYLMSLLHCSGEFTIYVPR